MSVSICSEKKSVTVPTSSGPNFLKAISKIEKLPESLNYINDKEEKFEVVSNDLEKVKDYVLRSI